MPVPKEAPPVEAAYQLMVPALAVAAKPTVPVPHREAGVLPVIVGIAVTFKFEPLSEPATPGLLLITLILYKEDVVAPEDIDALIVPAVICVKVPMAVGLLNDPVSSDSWAVNTFPELKVPEIVKATLTATPAQ